MAREIRQRVGWTPELLQKRAHLVHHVGIVRVGVERASRQPLAARGIAGKIGRGRLPEQEDAALRHVGQLIDQGVGWRGVGAKRCRARRGALSLGRAATGAKRFRQHAVRRTESRFALDDGLQDALGGRGVAAVECHPRTADARIRLHVRTIVGRARTVFRTRVGSVGFVESRLLERGVAETPPREAEIGPRRHDGLERRARLTRIAAFQIHQRAVIRPVPVPGVERSGQRVCRRGLLVEQIGVIRHAERAHHVAVSWRSTRGTIGVDEMRDQRAWPPSQVRQGREPLRCGNTSPPADAHRRCGCDHQHERDQRLVHQAHIRTCSTATRSPKIRQRRSF